MKRPFFRLSLIALLTSASTGAFAAAFMLNEQNAVQTGDFGAGGAAIAEDASTAWFNPAGLTRLDKPQVVLAGNGIVFDTKFTGTVTQQLNSPDGSILYGPYSQKVSDVAGGGSHLIPVFHAAYPISSNLVAGFSVTTPFGLETNYDKNSYTRYAATDTKLTTIDISPSLGFKINNKFSAGLGIDEQRLLATFDNYAGLDVNDTPPLDDTLSHNVASDWATGWHAGLLFQPTNTTRYGLTYHSKIVHHASGYSLFTGPLAGDPDPILYSGHAETTLNLPANTTFSAYHDMNNRWAVMGSVIYTQWDVLKNLTLSNLAALDPTDLSPSTNVNVNVPQNFHNTWRVSVGTNYKIAEQWLVRTGVGYDESPVNNTDRNLRLPDGDRYGIAFGGRYIATKNTTLDAGWTHEFIKSAPINNTSVVSAQQTTVAGTSRSQANVFGLQLTYTFA
jgi:long-chain fatty acid transport protein